DIEQNCNELKVYIDQLELEEKDDSELMKLDKYQIIDFKNYQITKLKAYIQSLEKEKEDLIENFRNTTSVLLERIKDLEQNQFGMRPQTPNIMAQIKKKEKYANGIDFEKEQKIERCPNCRKEFPEEDFIVHSLKCLRTQ